MRKQKPHNICSSSTLPQLLTDLGVRAQERISSVRPWSDLVVSQFEIGCLASNALMVGARTRARGQRRNGRRHPVIAQIVEENATRAQLLRHLDEVLSGLSFAIAMQTVCAKFLPDPSLDCACLYACKLEQGAARRLTALLTLVLFVLIAHPLLGIRATSARLFSSKKLGSTPITQL